MENQVAADSQAFGSRPWILSGPPHPALLISQHATLSEAPVASHGDVAIAFLLVSASVFPESHTAVKMDCHRAPWPCHSPPCLTRFRCAALPVEKSHRTARSGPSGSPGGLGPLGASGSQHTAWVGIAPAFGPHSCELVMAFPSGMQSGQMPRERGSEPIQMPPFP